MAYPREPKEARLVIGVLFSLTDAFDEVLKKLKLMFGQIIDLYEPISFEHTNYYKKEMGEGLKRTILVFDNLVRREDLYKIKLETNFIEKEFSVLSGDGSLSRQINLDPGILSLENFILASCKGYSHRIYLGSGVYADLTLRFQNNSFNGLQWTYPDYAQEGVIRFLNNVRLKYKEEIDRKG